MKKTTLWIMSCCKHPLVCKHQTQTHTHKCSGDQKTKRVKGNKEQI